MMSDVLKTLESAPLPDKRIVLANYIENRFREALHFSADDVLDNDASIFDLGLNSLGAESLKQSFETDLQIDVNTSDLFSNPTINHFIEYLYKAMFVSTDVAAGNRTEDEAEVFNMVNSMLHDMFESTKSLSNAD